MVVTQAQLCTVCGKATPRYDKPWNCPAGGHTRGIIDRHVQVLPADIPYTGAPITMDAVPDPSDPPQLFHIQVHGGSLELDTSALGGPSANATLLTTKASAYGRGHGCTTIPPAATSALRMALPGS